MKYLFVLLFIFGCAEKSETEKQEIRSAYLQKQIQDTIQLIHCAWSEKLKACFCECDGPYYSLTWAPNRVCGK